MRSAQDIFARILNRAGILKYYNVNAPVNFNGKKIVVPVHGNDGFSNLYIEKDFDYHVYDFFRREISNGIFLDIGANIGQTLLRVKSINIDQPIVCVEPSPACVDYLLELKSLNSFNSAMIIPAAIFDEGGIRKLYTRSSIHHDTGASLVNEDRPGWFGDDGFIMVNAINGAALAQQVPGKISFIKVDVEGAELPVLKTLGEIIKRDQPIVFCEVLDAHDNSVLERNNNLKKEVFQYIVHDLNYKIYRLDTKNKQLIAVDNFPNRLYSISNFEECNYIFKK